jgi:hypothetical protein
VDIEDLLLSGPSEAAKQRLTVDRQILTPLATRPTFWGL